MGGTSSLQAEDNLIVDGHVTNKINGMAEVIAFAVVLM